MRVGINSLYATISNGPEELKNFITSLESLKRQVMRQNYKLRFKNRSKFQKKNFLNVIMLIQWVAKSGSTVMYKRRFKVNLENTNQILLGNVIAPLLTLDKQAQQAISLSALEQGVNELQKDLDNRYMIYPRFWETTEGKGGSLLN